MNHKVFFWLTQNGMRRRPLEFVLKRDNHRDRHFTRNHGKQITIRDTIKISEEIPDEQIRESQWWSTINISSHKKICHLRDVLF